MKRHTEDGAAIFKRRSELRANPQFDSAAGDRFRWRCWRRSVFDGRRNYLTDRDEWKTCGGSLFFEPGLKILKGAISRLMMPTQSNRLRS
jgi:hypothetical protein